MNDTADPISPFRLVKGVEDRFPIPTPVETVEVGTFDGATGVFAGLVTVTLEPDPIPDPIDVGPGRKPLGGGGPLLKPKVLRPEVTVDAVRTALTFKIRNRQGEFRVVVNGLTVNVPADRSSITIGVGRASNVGWTVTSGAKSHRDSLRIKRPPIIGAGAFRVPALPVAVIYEPVPDAENRDRATYSTARSIGSTARFSFAQGSETTRPTLLPLSDLRQKAAKLAGGLQKIPVPKIKAMGKALDGVTSALDFALGSQSGSTASGESITSGGALALVELVEDGFGTGTNDGGPGVGDVLVILRDAELVWLAEGGDVSLALLGHRGVSALTAQFLRDGLQSGGTEFDPETLASVLELDPFVAGGPGVVLREPRFVKLEEYELNGVELRKKFSRQITQSDVAARSTSRVRIEEFSAGFLKFLGIGVQDTQTLKSTVTSSSSVEETSVEKVEVTADLHAEIDELRVIAIFYDRVFGTFAFQEVPVSDQALISGTALGEGGEVLANAEVTLALGDERISTRSDGAGTFAFHSTSLRSGSGTLTVGKLHRSVAFDGEPVLGLELR